MELNATIFLQIFIFVTLLLWLSRTLFAPIVALFDEREKRIVGAKEESMRLEKLAQEKAASFDTAYEKARGKAREALTQMKQQMEKEQSDSLEKAKHVARALVDKANSERTQQESEVRPQLMESSDAIAEEIVKALTRRTA